MKIGKRIERVFAHKKDRSQAEKQSPSEVRREILEQLESRIKPQHGGKVFPFRKVVVHLQPKSKGMSRVFKDAFIDNGSLESDILQSLKDSRARRPEQMEISVELRKDSISAHSDLEEFISEPLFKMYFLQPDLLRPDEIPEISLAISCGTAEQHEYRLKKDRILIGCSSEVEDREGRMVRRNDVVFLDNGDDINSTVSRIHARIWFNFEKRGFLVMDEGSRYGTRIVRKDRSIDVPSVHDQAILLQSGDEIFCGRASVRYLGTDH